MLMMSTFFSDPGFRRKQIMMKPFCIENMCFVYIFGIMDLSSKSYPMSEEPRNYWENQ